MRNAGRTDIVLVGGGHAHVHVLVAFAKRPEPDVRLILIARDRHTPYSGMLPGVIAGLYRRDEMHIDLARLAEATGARFIHGEVTGLDRHGKRIALAEGSSLRYDLVSLDVGITPALDGIVGAAEFGIAVKPIGSFLAKFDALLERCRAPGGPRRIAMIGGGAGGVEVLLALEARLRAEMGARFAEFSFALATYRDILARHDARVRDIFRTVFAERGIALLEHRTARHISPLGVAFEDGSSIAADAVLLATHAAAPAWFRDTDLALDEGYIAVGPTLQSSNDPDVFATGDCAALATPRAKAGVFAVRAGPPLADNLRRRARGEVTRPWHPQRGHLALISTGGRHAVASRGALAWQGRWLWTLKDWIDRRWVRTYQDVDRLRD